MFQVSSIAVENRLANIALMHWQYKCNPPCPLVNVEEAYLSEVGKRWVVKSLKLT
jgi:hypothetical protein